MNSDKSSLSKDTSAGPRPGVLVGRTVTVRPHGPAPAYFTDVHRQSIGKSGRVHAIVPSPQRDNPLVKVGFDEGTQIVFFRLRDLEVHGDPTPEQPRKHGKRGSHLPSG